jgi:hypothetical protein
MRYAVEKLVAVLHYKPEGREFNSLFMEDPASNRYRYKGYL